MNRSSPDSGPGDEGRSREVSGPPETDLCADRARAVGLERILSLAREGIWAIDREQRTTYVNPALAEMLGYRVEEMLLTPVFDYMDELSARETRARLSEIEEGTTLTFDFTFVSKDGRRVETTMHAAPIVNEEGVVEGAMASVLEVGEQRRRDVEHRSTSEQLALLADTVEAALWIAEDESEPVVTFVSSAVASILGRQPEQLVGSPERWLACVHSEDRHRVEASRRFLLRGESEAYEEEYRVVLPSGVARWVLDKARVIRDEGGVRRRICGVTMDVTERRFAEDERRRLDEKLLHKQKLESLGVLAGGVAHDFNNLLLAVIGNAEIGAASVDDPEASRRAFEEILEAGQRAAVLSRQMLAYSGRGGIRRTRVRLDEIARSTRAMLELAAGKGVELEVVHEEEIPSVYADADQLRQLLLNIVTNAGEAMRDRHGRIRVSIASRDCAGEELENPHLESPLPAGRYVVLEVLDEGEGMTPATLERLFDPFFSTRFPGRGLGMSAVLGILQGHQGGINVESRAGRGTRVEVLLPVTSEAERRNRKPAAPRPAEECGAVLLVDDEKVIRQVGERMVARLGYESVSVSSGYEAIELLRRQKPPVSVVVLDLTMPGMGGAQTFEAIRGEWPELPVVICSGYGLLEVSERLGDLVPDQVLHKPFRMSEMRSVLESLLGTR